MKTAVCAFALVLFSFGLIGCGGGEEAAVEVPADVPEMPEAVASETPPAVSESASVPASMPASMPASAPAEETSGMTADALLIAAGSELCVANDCVSCHSSDGSELQGPTFKGMYSKDQAVATEGFPVCCPGALGEEEVAAVIAYIKSVP